MRRDSGFTLIELLIVVGILGLLSAILLPQVFESENGVIAKADEANLARLGNFLLVYKQKHDGYLPAEDGHKLLLAPWTKGEIQRTEENLMRYYTPRNQDPTVAEKKTMLMRGEDPFPNLAATTSLDTHYAGRAKKHLATARGGADEALAATDNEGIWNLRDGTVNILFSDCITVRSYSYSQLKEAYGLPEFDSANPIMMVGEEAVIPACKKLAY